MGAVEEVKARIEAIVNRLREIDSEYASAILPDEVKSEWNTLNKELEEKRALVTELEARRQRVAELADEPAAREAPFNTRTHRVRGDEIYDLTTVRTSVTSPQEAARELTDRAKEAIERGQFTANGITREEAQANVLRLLETRDTDDAQLARRILETSSPTYERAFGKAVMGRPLTDSEARALSTSDSAGGYAIPVTLDPSVILTSNHSVNPYRAIARVVQTVTDNWNGVSSAGVRAAYAAEASEASDNAPSLGQPSISVEKAHVYVPFSIEVGQDWPGLRGELTMMVQEAKDDLESNKFTFGAGSGSDEPEGVLIGGTAVVRTAGTATFAVGDLYTVEEALPPRYRTRAQWIANRSIYNKVRQFDNNGGSDMWTENLQRGLANNVPTPGNTGYNLLGYQANECSDFGTSIATGGTILAFGDFSRYVIVDRVGMNVELVPLVLGRNGRPTGERGFYVWWRNSAEVVDPNAFRKLLAL